MHVKKKYSDLWGDVMQESGDLGNSKRMCIEDQGTVNLPIVDLPFDMIREIMKHLGPGGWQQWSQVLRGAKTSDFVNMFKPYTAYIRSIKKFLQRKFDNKDERNVLKKLEERALGILPWDSTDNALLGCLVRKPHMLSVWSIAMASLTGELQTPILGPQHLDQVKEIEAAINKYRNERGLWGGNAAKIWYEEVRSLFANFVVARLSINALAPPLEMSISGECPSLLENTTTPYTCVTVFITCEKGKYLFTLARGEKSSKTCMVFFPPGCDQSKPIGFLLDTHSGPRLSIGPLVKEPEQKSDSCKLKCEEGLILTKREYTCWGERIFARDISASSLEGVYQGGLESSYGNIKIPGLFSACSMLLHLEELRVVHNSLNEHGSVAATEFGLWCPTSMQNTYKMGEEYTDRLSNEYAWCCIGSKDLLHGAPYSKQPFIAAARHNVLGWLQHLFFRHHLLFTPGEMQILKHLINPKILNSTSEPETSSAITLFKRIAEYAKKKDLTPYRTLQKLLREEKSKRNNPAEAAESIELTPEDATLEDLFGNRALNQTNCSFDKARFAGIVDLTLKDLYSEEELNKIDNFAKETIKEYLQSQGWSQGIQLALNWHQAFRQLWATKKKLPTEKEFLDFLNSKLPPSWSESLKGRALHWPGLFSAEKIVAGVGMNAFDRIPAWSESLKGRALHWPSLFSAKKIVAGVEVNACDRIPVFK